MSDVFDAKAFLKTVTSQPGVYRMYDAGGTVIYAVSYTHLRAHETI
ncbi:hypothetical protein, partial [Klebsiella pneumoniae]